eukprot:UN16855
MLTSMIIDNLQIKFPSQLKNMKRYKFLLCGKQHGFYRLYSGGKRKKTCSFIEVIQNSVTFESINNNKTSFVVKDEDLLIKP